MPENVPRMLIIGAHPDDAEYHAGGMAGLFARHGGVVRCVSVTSGGAGHHQMQTPELIARRRQEAAASAAVIGAEYVVWSNPDGGLQPALAVRDQVITEIRTFAPDVVLTHRVNDYHPDHRAVAQLVQDASYMVTVPLVTAAVSLICSGAMKQGEPRALPGRVTRRPPISSGASVSWRARPRSVNRDLPSWPIRMLAGLTSRWMRPRS